MTQVAVRRFFHVCTLLLIIQVQLASLMSPLAPQKQLPQNKRMSFCCFDDKIQLVEGSGKSQGGASTGSI